MSWPKPIGRSCWSLKITTIYWPAAEKEFQRAIEVNGRKYPIHSDADTPHLFVLREKIGLTGTKYGCGEGQRGAWSVHRTDRRVAPAFVPSAGGRVHAAY